MVFLPAKSLVGRISHVSIPHVAEPMSLAGSALIWFVEPWATATTRFIKI